MSQPRAREIRRLIDLALTAAAPGTVVEVEVAGVRVRVDRATPTAATALDLDAQALADVQRKLAAFSGTGEPTP